MLPDHISTYKFRNPFRALGWYVYSLPSMDYLYYVESAEYCLSRYFTSKDELVRSASGLEPRRKVYVNKAYPPCIYMLQNWNIFYINVITAQCLKTE